jgi:hypothetical protein
MFNNFLLTYIAIGQSLYVLYPRAVASHLPSAGVNFKTQTCSEEGACLIKRASTSRRKIF